MNIYIHKVYYCIYYIIALLYIYIYIYIALFSTLGHCCSATPHCYSVGFE